MNDFKNIFSYFLIAASLVFLSACSSADADQNVGENPFVIKAKDATKKYNLTKISIACLLFEKLDKKMDGKTIVEVREKHGGTCGGDPKTSPRIFSIGFDDSTGVIWSDANSLLGQMEKINE